MLLFSFLGRLPLVLRWKSAALTGLIVLQYATVKAAVDFPFLNWLGALHPVIALLLFWFALSVFRQANKAGSTKLSA